MEELIAVPGEEMVIPCHYPLEILGEALQVTWYTGDSAECSFNASGIYTLNITQTSEAYGVSQVNFTEVSLRIPSAQRSELHFCCRVTTSSGQIKQSRSSTEVIITETGKGALTDWQI
ncbi:hypothetical protein GDO78_018556 [Eleutherodactylus coqui]|uniref:Ig-like domain-containing protein n=1 Tax=Eleutherodactylus coqui TaxID=57060 RepID=A0A8J6BCB4_ELECQ|nr:hypothetical protein GDO78_018556 [Eleutherodactylus coqui]